MSYRKIVEFTKKLVAQLIGIQYKNLTENTNMLLMDWSYSRDSKVKSLYKKGYPTNKLSVSKCCKCYEQRPNPLF